jgi:hypothetical protein
MIEALSGLDRLSPQTNWFKKSPESAFHHLSDVAAQGFSVFPALWLRFSLSDQQRLLLGVRLE